MWIVMDERERLCPFMLRWWTVPKHELTPAIPKKEVRGIAGMVIRMDLVAKTFKMSPWLPTTAKDRMLM
jgi:hypothetical protein